MGVRSNRYSMLVVDGVVKSLNVEGPGKFEVSDAGTMLAQAKQILRLPEGPKDSAPGRLTQTRESTHNPQLRRKALGSHSLNLDLSDPPTRERPSSQRCDASSDGPKTDRQAALPRVA